MNTTIRPADRLVGSPWIPPDKSIAHRAALFAALADGPSTLRNFGSAEDPRSTLSVLRQLGVEAGTDPDALLISGLGLTGLVQPDGPLDCGNSGTTLRLLAGVLAGQSFDSELVGDASLSRRPMGRIADPLRRMGAAIDLTDGHAPVRVTGRRTLQGIRYELPVASAQVKSCVLLAGLFAEGPTTVVEPLPTRDHTERMLGLEIAYEGAVRTVTVRPGMRPQPASVTVPADFSAAAFLLVAGTIVPESNLVLRGVGLNPTRTALLDVLREMGADLTIENQRIEGGEPIGDLTVRSAHLTGTSLDPRLVPNLIDEIPILAVASACAEGPTVIRGAAELRVKESDRIAVMAANLAAMGCAVEELEDGLIIRGGRRLIGASVESHGDHRIAMAMGIAGLVARGETTVLNSGCATVSYPNFWEGLTRLTARSV